MSIYEIVMSVLVAAEATYLVISMRKISLRVAASQGGGK